MTTVIGLEGLPFAGKTSAIEACRTAMPDFFHVLPDYHELEQVSDLEKAFPSSASEQMLRVTRYRALDMMRWTIADGGLACSHATLCDRTPASIAAYNEAVMGIEGWYNEDYIMSVHDWAASQINGRYSALIYLHTPAQEAMRRHAALASSMDARFRRLEFLEGLVSAYFTLLRRLEVPVHIVSANSPLAVASGEVSSIVRGLAS